MCSSLTKSLATLSALSTRAFVFRYGPLHLACVSAMHKRPQGRLFLPSHECMCRFKSWNLQGVFPSKRLFSLQKPILWQVQRTPGYFPIFLIFPNSLILDFFWKSPDSLISRVFRTRQIHLWIHCHTTTFCVSWAPITSINFVFVLTLCAFLTDGRYHLVWPVSCNFARSEGLAWEYKCAKWNNNLLMCIPTESHLVQMSILYSVFQNVFLLFSFSDVLTDCRSPFSWLVSRDFVRSALGDMLEVSREVSRKHQALVMCNPGLF